jgi:hypothetical protein
MTRTAGTETATTRSENSMNATAVMRRTLRVDFDVLNVLMIEIPQ